MIDLKSMTIAEMEEYLKQLGEPRFRAGQLFEWIQNKRAVSFDEMTDLPKNLRSRLFEAYRFESASVELVLQSKDCTRKYLLKMTLLSNLLLFILLELLHKVHHHLMVDSSLLMQGNY